MKKLLYFLAFAAAFSLWSCSDDDEGGDPDDPQFNLLSEARILSLLHIPDPRRPNWIPNAVFSLKKKKR